MTFAQLRYVLEVEKTGSINQAAKNLFFSQSVLSNSIIALEKQLGKDIFFRTNHGTTVTPFGTVFISFLKPISLQLEQLDTMFLWEKDSFSSTLSIASNGYHFISDICSHLYHAHKKEGLRLEIYDVNESEVVQYISKRIADIGLIRYWSCYEEGWENQLQALHVDYTPIARLDLAITVGVNSPLYNHPKDTISKDLLADYPMIMYNYLDEGPYADIFSRLNLPSSNSQFVTSSRATIYEILTSTDAFYLNSLYQTDLSSQPTKGYTPDLKSIVIEDMDIHSVVSIILHKNYNPTPIANEAIECIKKTVGNLPLDKN